MGVSLDEVSDHKTEDSINPDGVDSKKAESVDQALIMIMEAEGELRG